MHYKVNTVLEASDYEFSELYSLAAEQFVICCQWTLTARSLRIVYSYASCTFAEETVADT